ncbi:MAG: ATPase, partial [Asticcacaulis taihuensis]
LSQPLGFFGFFFGGVPIARFVGTIVDGDEVGAYTTVTFEERDGQTLVVWRDLYPSKEALDEAMISGATSGFGEQFEQLEALLADHTQAG